MTDEVSVPQPAPDRAQSEIALPHLFSSNKSTHGRKLGEMMWQQLRQVVPQQVVQRRQVFQPEQLLLLWSLLLASLLEVLRQLRTLLVESPLVAPLLAGVELLLGLLGEQVRI